MMVFKTSLIINITQSRTSRAAVVTVAIFSHYNEACRNGMDVSAIEL